MVLVLVLCYVIERVFAGAQRSCVTDQTRPQAGSGQARSRLGKQAYQPAEIRMMHLIGGICVVDWIGLN